MEMLQVNGTSYQVLRLLGKGKGGYSYLVSDGEKEYVIKQIHHEPCAYYEFGNKLESEIADYKKLKRIGIAMPELLDVDEKQERILKEYIQGDTVYEMVLHDCMPEECMVQIHKMCDRLYKANTNIDYFPTNFVMQGNRLYYIDYECNPYSKQWDFENWGIKYWSKTKAFLAYGKKKEQVYP